MNRRTKFLNIGKCLDRYAKILEKDGDEAGLKTFNKNRISRFIDLDVSRIDAAKLAEADDMTFVHDMAGVFSNIVRNPDNPEKSFLHMFEPRVGFTA